MYIRQEENILTEIEELMRRTLLNYPSYFMNREEEIKESIGDEREDIINEIYFEFITSESQDLFGFIDILISEENYTISDNLKQSLNEFKEDIVTLDIQDDMLYYLEDLYEERLSNLKNNILNSRDKNSVTLDIIKHCRANKHSMARCDDIINSYKKKL